MNTFRRVRSVGNNFDVQFINGEILQDVPFSEIKNDDGHVLVQVSWSCTERMNEKELREFAENGR